MRRGKHAAFTLIEVLVALAIVSIGMLAVIQAVSQTVDNAAYLRDKTLAHWVAMNQLTLMRLNQAPTVKGTSSGDADMAGQRWRWSAEVTQTAIDSMLRIDITVRAADADEHSQLATLTGFLGQRIAKPGTLIAQYTPTTVAPAGVPAPAPAAPAPVPVPPTTPSVPTPGAPGDQSLIR